MNATLNRLWCWFYALHLRLLKKISFVVVLCLIPLLTVLFTLTAKEDAGFVKIAVAADEPTDPLAASIVQMLCKESNVALMVPCDSAKEAEELVVSGKADTAWVLPENMATRIAQVADGKQETLVRVYAREDGMLVRVSREKLFPALYQKLTYIVYAKYVQALPFEQAPPSEEAIQQQFEANLSNDKIVNFEFLDSPPVDLSAVNYLTTPLRGMLACIMLLCGMAASLYFNADEREKRFSTLPVTKRWCVFFVNNIAALSISAVFVTIALLACGMYISFWAETVAMLLFIVTAALFCLLLGTLFRSVGALSMCVPIVLIVSLALSPVFYNAPGPKVIQVLLPTYHYLYAVNDSSYYLGMLLYVVLAAVVSLTLYTYRNRMAE